MNKHTEKIINFDCLAPILSQHKKNGKRIVLCHGVFDLLHSGHLLHFRSAKQHGEMLIVSVTPDCFVNKGPSRPYFNQNIRLQNIAELESVDYVVLNEWPTAIETIFKIKPDVYAKGVDYMNAKDDITGNIGKEEEAVREMGGKIIFTREPSLSSSSLLNEFFPDYSEEARKFLRSFKAEHTVAQINGFLDALYHLKVLVIGEAICDRYTYCMPLAKSTKETIIASKYMSEENFLGGALAVANHVSNFCKSVTLITNLGFEKGINDFIYSKLKSNIHLKNIFVPERPTILKQRFVEHHLLTKMFEIQNMDDRPLPPVSEADLWTNIETELSAHDLVIIGDYGHGFLTDRIVSHLEYIDKFICINAQTNSANLGFNLITKYKRADYICIDEPELKFSVNRKYVSVEEMVKKLRQRISVPNMLVSLGAKGTIFFGQEGNGEHVPVFSNKVVDRTGAGDALFSVTAPLMFLKCPSKILGFIANCVGALAVRTICNRHQVSSVDLKKFMKVLLA